VRRFCVSLCLPLADPLLATAARWLCARRFPPRPSRSVHRLAQGRRLRRGPPTRTNAYPRRDGNRHHVVRRKSAAASCPVGLLETLTSITFEQIGGANHSSVRETALREPSIASADDVPSRQSFLAEWYAGTSSTGRQVTTNNREPVPPSPVVIDPDHPDGLPCLCDWSGCGIAPDFSTPEFERFATVQTQKWETCEGASHSFLGHHQNCRLTYRRLQASIHVRAAFTRA